MKIIQILVAMGSVGCLIAAPAMGAAANAKSHGTELRQTVSLDGSWQIAEGQMEVTPTVFDHSVTVPGLVDMAQPAFAETGVQTKRRKAFWYRRTFRIEQQIPEVALLKLHKAMFSSRVILNGKEIGEHRPSFTPGNFNVKGHLRQGENEIIIRVGAYPTEGQKSIGWDIEKTRYIPGIFDSVELILSGTPHIDRVQVVPDVQKGAVTVHTWPAQPAHFTVREARSQRVVGEADGAGPVTIPIGDCQLWTPEAPFLYEISVRTSGDELTTRFGMRTFRLDPQTGRAILNGKPYFMRGSNVTLYRFFEDANRGGLPWSEAWVRQLHRRFKEVHWNALRYSIGFPPELWYRIADEEGFLIQDEFPIWMPFVKPGEISADSLAEEYREWMEERWNHPSVVVWDACNETSLPETAAAIAKVRDLDFSNRPWDNGWRKPARASDVFELHPYHFMEPDATLELLGYDPGTLNRAPGKNAIIVNEYGWLWLNRDGTPTKLTQKLYENLLGAGSTTDQRRHLYARYLAAETEFWRAHRACAAVLQFCALGYSRSDGQTSDHWLDVATLKWEPEFFRYVRDAFAPVGVMIDDFTPIYKTSQRREFSIRVTNDLENPWKGQVSVQLLQGSQVIATKELPLAVESLGSAQVVFEATMPAQSGECQLRATLVQTPAGDVTSVRDFAVITPQQWTARNGIALNKPATASSFEKREILSGAQTWMFEPQNAVDGSLASFWGSEPRGKDPQWLAVDLQTSTAVGRVELVWKKSCAKSYAIQVSNDGQAWTEVYKTATGKGGTESITFPPVEARWVRFWGTECTDKGSGYQISEFRVFAD